MKSYRTHLAIWVYKVVLTFTDVYTTVYYVRTSTPEYNKHGVCITSINMHFLFRRTIIGKAKPTQIKK